MSKKMELLPSDEIKKIELDILIEFDKYCRKHNLTYFLCYGTLLGAVRHKGFIPWDDDIDVFMPRMDYERFLDETGYNPINEKLLTVSYKKTKRKNYNPFTKIVNKETVAYESWAAKKECSGIWIDVFALDGFSDNINIDYKLNKKRLFWRKVLFFSKSNFITSTNIVKRILKILIKPFTSFALKRIACRKIDKLAQRYSFENSSYVGCCQWGYGIKERLDKSVFNPIEIEFEGYHFFAPRNYDEYLKALYGNYMELPPEDKRISHSIQAWKI